MNINLATIDFRPGQGGGVNPSGTFDITSNGVYDVYSYASASVSVHPSNSLSETYTSNGSYNISGEFNGGEINVSVPFYTELLSVSDNGTYTPGEGVDGFSQVVVDVHPSSVFSGSYSSNGLYNISGEFNGGEISVNVPFYTQVLSVSDNGTYTPGEGIDGFSQVVVDVPQSVTGFTQKEIVERTYLNVSTLNNSASFVGSYAFCGQNDALKTVILNNCTAVNISAFTYTGQGSPRGIESVSLPVCTYFGPYAFQNNTSLSSLYAPNLEIIENNVFSSCYNLTEIRFPKLSYLGNSAFANCFNIQLIELNSCRTIGFGAFSGCTNIESVYMNSVNSLPSYAFSMMSKLKTVELNNCSYMLANTFTSCSALESVSLPNLISFSGGYQFANCSSLQTVDLPMLSVVYSGTFYNCYALSSINLPMLYMISGDTAFTNCSSLTEIDLPLCYYINGSSTFTNCSSLTKINMPLCYSLIYNRSYQGLNTLQNLNDITFGTQLYFVPDYISLGTYFMNNNGVINVDAEMYDMWVSHSQWGSMSLYFSSYVSTNSTPMLSVSDGVLYGRTLTVTTQVGRKWFDYVGTSSITAIDLEECKMITGQVFNNISTLTNISLPQCQYLYGLMSGCYNVSSIYLGNCQFITGAISGCRGTLTIATSKVCLCTTNPFRDGTPTSIYVPASLVDEYKSTQYWSSCSNLFFPITE